MIDFWNHFAYNMTIEILMVTSTKWGGFMQTEVLDKVSSGDLTVEEAYNTLYPDTTKNLKALKRARFIRFKIHVPDESPSLNAFLRLLFIFPIPVSLVNFGLRFVKQPKELEGKDIDFQELKQLIKYSSGTRVNILSKDAKITIKID